MAKKSNVRPKNGRWPIEFLMSQLDKMKADLGKTQEVGKKELDAVLKVLEKPADSADMAQLLACQGVSIELAERLASKECHMKRAILFISKDLSFNKPHAHEYGVCTECGRFISSRRLELVPWGSACVLCQKELEETSAAARGR